MFSIPDKKGWNLLLLFIGGTLTGLSLVFPQVGFLEWVSLVPAIWALYTLSHRERLRPFALYGYGFAFFMFYYLVIYHWFFYLYPLDFAGISHGSAAALVALCWLGLSALQAFTGGLIFVGAGLLARTKAVKAHPALWWAAIPALWVIFEWSQTLGWTGVPWGRLCLGQAEYSIMMQSASLFGSYFISFCLLICNFFVCALLRCGERRRFSAMVAGGALLLNLLCGGSVLLANAIRTAQPEDSLVAAGIQGNFTSDQKWSGTLWDMLEIYCDLTRQAAAEGAELVVWPETAIPNNLLSYAKEYDMISELAKECDITLFVGAFAVCEDGSDANAVFGFNPDGSLMDAVYYKRHLVPYGEYVPLRDFVMAVFPVLTEIGMLEEDLTAGVSSSLFSMQEGGMVGAIICFDSIYENLTAQSVQDGANLMILPTNDSWFYDSAAGKMHLVQARLRAIENGRCIVRAANTGISAIIHEDGSVIDREEALQRGYVIGSVCLQNRTTLYSQTGNIPMFLLCGILIAAALFWRRKEQ